jgi:hypothetical protein
MATTLSLMAEFEKNRRKERQKQVKKKESVKDGKQ